MRSPYSETESEPGWLIDWICWGIAWVLGWMWAIRELLMPVRSRRNDEHL